MRLIKSVTGIAAVASLALAGAAQAQGTQSANMLPKSSYAQRASAPATGANAVAQRKNRGTAVVLAAIGLGLVVAGVAMSGDKDDAVSGN